MAVMTIKGSMPAEELGVILPHEHIFFDISNQFSEFNDDIMNKRSHLPVGIEHLDILRRNPYALKDNLTQMDITLAFEEVGFFKRAGGNTIVDVTLKDIGRNISGLLEISGKLDINIVSCTGYYTGDTHPVNMGELGVEDITREMIKELNAGIDDTGIRAGVIGEIGMSNEFTENEKKVLRAAAFASAETGAPIMVHIYPWGKGGLDALDIITLEGVKADRVCICHSDVALNKEYMRNVLERGAYLEFDNFGKEFDIDRNDGVFAGGGFARDIERVIVMTELCQEGFGARLLMSNDICLKTLLHSYGGRGYDHCISNIALILTEQGLSEAQLSMLLHSNPACYLDNAKLS